MRGTQKIIDRFPSFYKSWDSNSLIYMIVSALGKRLEEAENELIAILRAHWVDTAMTSDLDLLGTLFNMKRRPNESDTDYRDRLKRAVTEYKGGGTINSVLTSVKMVLGLPEEQLELVENPPERLSKKLKVKAGEIWRLSSNSISEADPTITISVESESSKITNPTITNLDTNESITFEGVIQNGRKLIIKNGKGTLDGVDATEKLSTIIVPKLLRKASNWQYSELIERKIGLFDTARFNDSIFEIGVAPTTVIFDWTAHQPATFEIRIPRGAMSKRDLSRAQEVVDSTKAVGIRAAVKLIGE